MELNSNIESQLSQARRQICSLLESSDFQNDRHNYSRKHVESLSSKLQGLVLDILCVGLIVPCPSCKEWHIRHLHRTEH